MRQPGHQGLAVQRSARRLAVALVAAAILPAGLVACTIDTEASKAGSAQQAASTETQTSLAAEEEAMQMPNPTPPNEESAMSDSANPDAVAPGDAPQQQANRATTRADGSSAVAGKVIYLDPGHAGTPPPADMMVTDGRGGQKPCNTSGTASNDGFPEHEFNWLMAQEIKQLLEQRGAQVLLSRVDDTGRADCIDARAEKENASNADAVVSLHADGAGEGNRGFHVSAISQPLANNDEPGSTALATALRDAFVAAGFAPSNYLGSEGLNPRADLTGLNLSTKPKALVEYGNMRDSSDIALLNSNEGRQRLAEATVAGLEGFLAQ